jgi:hypothetical protein
MRHRAQRRNLFAKHICAALELLNTQEDWHDYRFADLEAEVEAQGRRRGPLGLWLGRDTGRRREKSLARALQRSRESKIAVVGTPGSGKSVALRHVALSIAGRASRSHRIDSTIPIYVNLRELHRDPATPIGPDMIERFVLKQLRKGNNRDIEEFLTDEFDAGKKAGTWVFVFDSFDEIPEVLSSADAQTTTGAYARAIAEFASSFNECRSILASREYRGPAQLGWPRFEVLLLSEKRQKQLVSKSGLPYKRQAELVGRLAMASQDLRSLLANPMFLGLVCDHVRRGGEFPENAYAVFATYLDRRLARDAQHISSFGVTVSDVNAVADAAAFAMASAPGLGLSPSRGELVHQMEAQEALAAELTTIDRCLVLQPHIIAGPRPPVAAPCLPASPAAPAGPGQPRCRWPRGQPRQEHHFHQAADLRHGQLGHVRRPPDPVAS